MTLLWTQISDVVPGICWSLQPGGPILSSCFFLMMLSLGAATTMSTWFPITSLSSHRILAGSFSTTSGGVSLFELAFSSPDLVRMLLYTIAVSCSC